MQQFLQISVLPKIAHSDNLLHAFVATKLNLPASDIRHISILKRSIDARQKYVKINLRVQVFILEEPIQDEFKLPQFNNVKQQEEIVIIGAGPAGLFAALHIIALGKRPIVIERGKDVRERRRDLKSLMIDHTVNPESNYCFGEGGAGTYSDGKLYTRSKKRGDVDAILKWFVVFGASKDILVDAHPHIGTNKLPNIIANMREFILAHGGVVQFNKTVVDIELNGDQIQKVVFADGDKIETQHVILATGHSARDIYEMLHRNKIEIEAKPFALGVRIEHPQTLIDTIQYHCDVRSEYLPASAYKIVKQVNGRGVYSFCMCPGGVIAPCATNPGEVVTNGWSPSKRDQPFANSGIVVELKEEDFKPYEKYGPLAAMLYQKDVEQLAWKVAGKTQKVPAQKMLDFLNNKVSNHIGPTSYVPGTTSVALQEVLPKTIHQSLQTGLRLFGKSMKGYVTNEAVIHAPESRTSSTVKIPRDRETLQHIRIQGLYPCGEGAGYAGGIISAAIDGQKCAEQCVLTM